MTTAVTPTSGPSPAALRRAWGNAAWVAGSLVVFAGWVALADAIPASDPDQLTVKSWLALVAVIGAVVQLTTISRVYGWSKRIPPGAVPVLAAVHRWSGRVTLAVGGAVFYMCVTAPFASGYTTHRLVGYLLAAVIVVKVVVLRADRWPSLLPYLGILAFSGWVTCFMTKGFSVLF